MFHTNFQSITFINVTFYNYSNILYLIMFNNMYLFIITVYLFVSIYCYCGYVYIVVNYIFYLKLYCMYVYDVCMRVR